MASKADVLILKKSLVFPVLFTALLWIVKFAELYFNLNFTKFGLLPLDVSGLLGIITAPLIHSDVQHLWSNTIGVFLLSWGLCYFYKEISRRVFFLIYILSGSAVWFFAREAYHIGASGLVYGLASFLFFSGVFRRHVPLAALSLVIVFLYGGIIWGLLPTFNFISWETHLTGFVSGVLLAIYFRKEGPQRPQPFADETDEEEMTEDEIIDNYLKHKAPKNNDTVEVKYHYKKKSDDE